MREWTVWVGGTEINDYLVTKTKAIELKIFYINSGYTDVHIEKVG